MNPEEILQHLISLGYRKHEAIGIMGNLKHESDFNPKAVGDGGKAYGIAQWHPDRQAKFRNKFGKSIKDSTVKEQLNFLDYELKNHEQGAYKKLKNSKNAKDATYAFAAFERFEGWDNPRHNKYTTRLNYAKGYHNSFYNVKNTPKMNDLDEVLIRKLGLNKVPQYSSPKGIWDQWKNFDKNRKWIRENKPEQEKAFVKFYADKGYITRNSNGDPDGPFNRLIIDKKNADEKKANGGISSSKKEVTELFGVANNLEKILGTSWYNSNKQRYDAKDDGQFLNKENGFTSDKYLTPEQKKVVDKIMKPYSKNGKRKASDTFVNDKGTSFYNTVELLKALETNVNKHLPEKEQLDIIDDKTGKRGKDLAFNADVGSHLGKSKRISAGKIYIPDKSNLQKSRVLAPAENLLPENTFDYIDPGYDDPKVDDPADFDFNQWNETPKEGMPEAPSFGQFKYPDFNYLPESVKNTPEYERFKKVSKEQFESMNAEQQQKLTDDVKKVADQYAKDDLNGFLTNMQTMSDNLPETTNKGYNPETQKRNDFPFLEAASSLYGILSGKSMAETELPERNEQVSDLFRNFTSEIKKLSEIGLKPEEEAYAKNMLTESYQANLDMVQRASNGNRNIVLGNLGRLDYQKQKGLLDLAVADNRAKTEALFKYGEAVKYISEFDANRDIVNNERAYQNAMMTKQAGGQLAAQGWASLMDNIQYFKENKPGSANAMLKSHYMRSIYDMDPNETDENNYYSPQQYAKRTKEFETYRQNVTQVNDTLQSLPENDKMFFQQYFQKTGNNFSDKNTLGMLEFLANNPGDKGKMDLNKLGQAKESNNYSVLFDGINSANPTAVNQGTIDNAKSEVAVQNIAEPTIPKADPSIVKQNNPNAFLESDYSKAFNSENALFQSGILGMDNEMIDKYNSNNYNFL